MDSDQKDTAKEKDGAAAAAEGGSSSLTEDAAAGGFEVTADRLEQLMKSMEVMLYDVEQLRVGYGQQAAELAASAAELQRQQEDLKESYAGLGRDMQEVVDTMDGLIATKSAIDEKERQEQKLSRQL